MLRSGLFLLLMMVFLFSTAFAEETDVPHEIIDGKLYIAGYVLAPAQRIDCSGEEAECLVKCDVSPGGRWIVIYFGNGYGNENFWLYDVQKKLRPVPLNAAGRNMSVYWHGDDIVEITAGGTGYTISYVYKTSDPRMSTILNDMLLLDESRELSVSLSLDGPSPEIVVRRLFGPERAEERFAIPLEFEYDSDAFMNIEHVDILGSRLLVEHRRMDGTLAREVFSPKLLQ